LFDWLWCQTNQIHSPPLCLDNTTLLAHKRRLISASNDQQCVTPCIPSVVDKGITCSLILYFLLHSKTCKYDWSNMSQFVRAHFIQMHVCVFVICYIRNVVKYDFIYTVTENQHSCNFECPFLWYHTSVPGLHFICECSIYLG
jgi:hypothetical protein